jgi:hypothetical protein
MQDGQISASASAAEIAEGANEEQQQLGEQANNKGSGSGGEQLSTTDPAYAPIQLNSGAAVGAEPASARTDAQPAEAHAAATPVPDTPVANDPAFGTEEAGGHTVQAEADHVMTDEAPVAEAATTDFQTSSDASELALGAERVGQVVPAEAGHAMTDAAAAAAAEIQAAATPEPPATGASKPAPRTEAAGAAGADAVMTDAAAASDLQTSSTASEPTAGTRRLEEGQDCLGEVCNCSQACTRQTAWQEWHEVWAAIIVEVLQQKYQTQRAAQQHHNVSNTGATWHCRILLHHIEAVILERHPVFKWLNGGQGAGGPGVDFNLLQTSTLLPPIPPILKMRLSWPLWRKKIILEKTF